MNKKDLASIIDYIVMEYRENLYKLRHRPEIASETNPDEKLKDDLFAAMWREHKQMLCIEKLFAIGLIVSILLVVALIILIVIKGVQ